MLRRGVLAVVISLAGCAGRGVPSAVPKPSVPERPTLAGLWEGLTRSTVRDGAAAGDTRIERQVWKLIQHDDAVTGTCIIELTMISGDGRPYQCSQDTHLQALIRVEVKGHLTADGVHVDDVGQPQIEGPCALSMHPPRSFQLRVRGNTMVVSDGSNQLSLTRRPPSNDDDKLFATASHPAPVVAPAHLNLLAAEEDAPLASAEGYWQWDHTSAVAGGDEKTEREEWHLVQEGDRISGHYDRWVRQLSTDGHPYRCSGSLEFRVGTRYRVTGEVRGNSVTIYERAYEILEGEACDQGRHHLDAYQGRIGDDEIRLLWGTGVQVLRRGRPDVPTQKF